MYIASRVSRWTGIESPLRIDHEHIELLRMSFSDLAFHRKARIAGNEVYLRARVAKVGKEADRVVIGAYDFRIYFIKAEVVARPRPRRYRSRAETNHSHAQRRVLGSHAARMVHHDQPDAAVG